MTSKHITNCPCCFKIFKRSGCYEKHIFTCQRKNEAVGERIPDTKQLYEMITILTEKYNSVQSELENMKQHVRNKNKKIDVLTWLNEQDQPKSGKEDKSQPKHHSLYYYIENMGITVSDLELIFKNGFIEGTVEIINSYFENEQIRETFKCFEQKKNIIYVFDGEWKECKSDDFNKIYNVIYNKMLVTFDVYKTENESKLRDEHFQIEYSDNFMKLLCVNIPTDKKIVRIRNRIYNEFKENFKTITELEI
jgi:hypothetical protein